MMVRMRGLEPPRPYGHGDLNAARLPIPPHPRVGAGDDIALGDGEGANRSHGLTRWSSAMLRRAISVLPSALLASTTIGQAAIV